MPLRIGFDMDGVLADFARAYHDVEVGLFGPVAPTRVGDPENEPVEAEGGGTDEAGRSDPPEREPSAREAKRQPREARRRHDAVWQAIRATQSPSCSDGSPRWSDGVNALPIADCRLTHWVVHRRLAHCRLTN